MQAYLKLDHIDKSFTRGNATSEVLKEINLTIDMGERGHKALELLYAKAHASRLIPTVPSLELY